MKPKYLIIHHTATSRDKTTFEAIKRGHIRKGWGNIGYHFVITADGTLHEGRGQDQIGAHAKADLMNYKSLGIALTGNFMTEKPTQKQLKTLSGIISQLSKIWNIPLKNVLGHKEVKGAKTVCPGTYLIKFIQDLRDSEKSSSDTQNELVERINELKKINGELKTKNNKLTNKLTNSKEFIKTLKVALESKKTWVDKLLELIKKNENI